MLHFMSLLALTLICVGELVLIINLRSRLNYLKKRSGRVDRILGPNLDPKHWSGEKR